ncbi:hypothetical protein Dda_3423 [Drechslerella dactyloides]|uniref:Uncharacterized protein n=1 Tax=Drechslerella dactyloides TaxID=74499 RepID=A0AAD6NLJ5_DREDA|nr:hypothetical protein Dda_3423 [Drechslerella dactyloides]
MAFKKAILYAAAGLCVLPTLQVAADIELPIAEYNALIETNSAALKALGKNFAGFADLVLTFLPAYDDDIVAEIRDTITYLTDPVQYPEASTTGGYNDDTGAHDRPATLIYNRIDELVANALKAPVSLRTDIWSTRAGPLEDSPLETALTALATQVSAGADDPQDPATLLRWLYNAQVGDATATLHTDAFEELFAAMKEMNEGFLQASGAISDALFLVQWRIKPTPYYMFKDLFANAKIFLIGYYDDTRTIVQGLEKLQQAVEAQPYATRSLMPVELDVFLVRSSDALNDLAVTLTDLVNAVSYTHPFYPVRNGARTLPDLVAATTDALSDARGMLLDVPNIDTITEDFTHAYNNLLDITFVAPADIWGTHAGDADVANIWTLITKLHDYIAYSGVIDTRSHESVALWVYDGLFDPIVGSYVLNDVAARTLRYTVRQLADALEDMIIVLRDVQDDYFAEIAQSTGRTDAEDAVYPTLQDLESFIEAYREIFDELANDLDDLDRTMDYLPADANNSYIIDDGTTLYESLLLFNPDDVHSAEPDTGLVNPDNRRASGSVYSLSEDGDSDEAWQQHRLDIAEAVGRELGDALADDRDELVDYRNNLLFPWEQLSPSGDLDDNPYYEPPDEDNDDDESSGIGQYVTANDIEYDDGESGRLSDTYYFPARGSELEYSNRVSGEEEFFNPRASDNDSQDGFYIANEDVDGITYGFM